MIPYLLAALGGYLIYDGAKKKATAFADGGEVSNWRIMYYRSIPTRGGNTMTRLEEQDSMTGTLDMVSKQAQQEVSSEGYDYAQIVDAKGKLSGAKVTKMADGGETTGEYAVRVFGNDQETDSVMSWVYDIQADNQDEAIQKAEEMFNYEWGLSGIDFIKAQVIRMEEIPVYEDGGEAKSFTFKTREEYDAKTIKSDYFEYDTIQVDALKGDITFYFQPKSQDEYKAIKTSKLYKIIAEKPIRAYFDKSEYEERDDYYEKDEDDYDDYAKGGKVKFQDKVDAIADRLEGTKVPARLRKDYGGRYNRKEAEEAGRRIAGAQIKKDGEKSNKKNTFVSANARENQSVKLKSNTMSTSKKGEKIKLISAHAKKIWNKEKGEKWKDAIKRASAELKKQNKI